MISNLSNGLVVLVVLLVALLGVGKQNPGKALSNEQGKCLKGLAAISLILVHIQNVIPFKTAYSLLAAFGYLFVGTFFFYTGFGITKQSIRNKAYFKTKLPSKLIYLIKMMVITEAIYLLIHVTLLRETYGITDVILSLCGIHLINGALWYIVALIIIYIVLIIGGLFIKAQNTRGGVYTISNHSMLHIHNHLHYKKTPSS